MRSLVVAVLISLAVLPVAAATFEERLAPCLACHGEHGQSAIPEVPSLGAQPAFYVTIQLYMFRERMRVVEPMNEVTKGLSDDDVRRMAELISKLPPPLPAAEPPDPARRATDSLAMALSRWHPTFEAMQQAVYLVNSALGDFYATLSDEQKAQFEAIGQKRTA